MFKTRIKKGAKLLDQNAPGWTRKIRITDLKMEDAYFCILGQYYGDYGEGLTRLSETSVEEPLEESIEGEDYGFELPEVWYMYESRDYNEGWNRLTEEWKELIRERRAARTG